MIEGKNQRFLVNCFLVFSPRVMCENSNPSIGALTISVQLKGFIAKLSAKAARTKHPVPLRYHLDSRKSMLKKLHQFLRRSFSSL